MGDIEARIRRCWSGEIRWGCPLAAYSTLKVGGPADALIRPAGRDELVRLVGRLSEEGVPWRVIGRGSNIVVADQGVEGVVIVLGRQFAAIRELPAAVSNHGVSFESSALPPSCKRLQGAADARNRPASYSPLCEQADDKADAVSCDCLPAAHRVEVEAGCSLASLGHWCQERALAGLEFATGIPGTVGGAIMMNAGAWGGEIGRVLSAVELLDARGRLEERELSPDDFCYRGWRQPHGKVVVSGVFTLVRDERTAIAERCHRYARQRAAKQPKGVASAGSFFKNPVGESAGRLIESAGLKGLRVGDAEVSPVHANFLVNRGAAQAADLRELMVLVQGRVRQRFGVELHPEVEFIGRWQVMDEKPLGEK